MYTKEQVKEWLSEEINSCVDFDDMIHGSIWVYEELCDGKELKDLDEGCTSVVKAIVAKYNK